MTKSKKNKKTSVKEVENIEEVETEEELEDVEEEVVEEDDFEEDDDFEEEYEEIGLEERLANIEKKTNSMFWMVIAILVVSCLSLVIALTNGGNSSTDTSTGTTSQEETSSGYDTSAFNAIKPADIESLSKNNTIVVWIGYQQCQFCQAYAPLLAQVTEEYGITANYIDITTITESELNEIKALTGKGDWKEFAASFSGTPFTLIIKNNKVVGGINGLVEASKIADAFDDAGLKK